MAQVIDAYTRMLKAKKGEIDAIVTTAEPLTPQQEKALAAGLKAQVGCCFLFPLSGTFCVSGLKPQARFLELREPKGGRRGVVFFVKTYRHKSG